MSLLLRNRWMLVPPLLLTLSVGFAVLAVSLAMRGAGGAVESGYYEKAAHWDDTMAQRRRNDAAGWIVTPAIQEATGRQMKLELAINDKHGIPIDAAALSVTAFPLRSADAPIVLTLREGSRGRYEGLFDAAVAGQWEFRVVIDRAGVHVTDVFRRIVAPASAGGRP